MLNLYRNRMDGRVAVLFVMFFALSLPTGMSQEDESGMQPVPSAEQRKLKRAEIEKQFDFSKQHRKSGKYFLSGLLLNTSRKIDVDTEPITKFVLLNMSRELAADAGDSVGAMRAIAMMEPYYKIDVFSIKVVSLRRVGDAAELNERERTKALFIGQQLLDQKYKEADFENAEKLSLLLVKLAKKFRNPVVLKDVQSIYDRISNGDARKEIVSAAHERLKLIPNDSEANWTIAKYELLHGRGWEAAVPFMENSSLPYSEAISAESRVTEAHGNLYAGQCWVRVSEYVQDQKLKRMFLARALTFFYKAKQNLDGYSPEYVQSEIDKVERQGIKITPLPVVARKTPAKVDWGNVPHGSRRLQDDVFDLRWAMFDRHDVLEAMDVRKHKIGNQWRKEAGVLHSPLERFDRIRMPFVFPEQYDLRIDCKNVSGHGCMVIALPASTGHRFLVQLNGQRPDFSTSGLETIDGVSSVKNQTRYDRKLFKPGYRSRVLVSVRRESIAVSVNEKQIIHYTGSQDVLRCRGRGPWQDKEDLTAVLGTYESHFEFHGISLRAYTAGARFDHRPGPVLASGSDHVGFRRGDTSIPEHVLEREQVYLDTVPEAGFFVGHGTMGRQGEKGYAKDNRVRLGGLPLSHAISTHPPSDGAAHVQYHLGRQFKTLTMQPGVADSVGVAEFDLRFTVFGDGRILKQSESVTKRGALGKWKIDVSDVDTLLLMVHCGKQNRQACAIWADPLLEK